MYDYSYYYSTCRLQWREWRYIGRRTATLFNFDLSNLSAPWHANLLARQPHEQPRKTMTTDTKLQSKPVRGGKCILGDVASNGTLSLSRRMFFEVAVLSPLAAAWDAMDAAMLTRKIKERWRREHVRVKEEPFIGQQADVGGASERATGSHGPKFSVCTVCSFYCTVQSACSVVEFEI